MMLPIVPGHLRPRLRCAVEADTARWLLALADLEAPVRENWNTSRLSLVGWELTGSNDRVPGVGWSLRAGIH